MPQREAAIGLLVGLLLGAGGLYAVDRFLIDPGGACGGRCGAGTRCDGMACVVEPSEAPTEEVAPEEEAKGKRRKGKRGRGKRGRDGDAPVLTQGPPVDDDGKVPRFKPLADETIGMDDGTERLSDRQIDAELAELDPAFQKCVKEASQRVDELGSGTVRYSFGVASSGKVTGVNVRAPANLKDAGIVPCVRLAVFGHRFPTYDGPTMKVKSSFSVD